MTKPKLGLSLIFHKSKVKFWSHLPEDWDLGLVLVIRMCNKLTVSTFFFYVLYYLQQFSLNFCSSCSWTESHSAGYLWPVGLACAVRPTAAVPFLPLAMRHLLYSSCRGRLMLRYIIIMYGPCRYVVLDAGIASVIL